MALFKTDGVAEEDFAGKWVFLDTNFLSLLAGDFDALAAFQSYTSRGARIVDPNVKFELLRSVFLPERRAILEEFVGDDDLFLPAPDHQVLFSQLRENALTLSYIYAQNGAKSASMVDLLLASRALLHGPDRVFVVTANRKDFPQFLFDSKGFFIHESERGESPTAFGILSLSLPKYNAAIDRWRRLG